MATEKRERQRQNRALKQQERSKVDKQQETKQRVTTIAIAVAVMVLLAALYYFFARDDDDSTETTSDETAESTSSTVSETTPTTPGSAISIPEPGGTIEGPTECPAADGSSERITTFSEAPPTCIDPAKSYTAVLETTQGEITIELDPTKAPNTVNNFVVLSRYHFYDGAPFHRIIPDFMIQGGDAVGPTPGVGTPGYTIAEEEPEAGEYEVGSVAMAKSQGPSATGAQFFIITGPQGVALPPEYSLFGTVTEGMDVVEAIESIPTTVRDQPTEETYIVSATIIEG